jgi:hypothetical protein
MMMRRQSDDHPGCHRSSTGLGTSSGGRRRYRRLALRKRSPAALINSWIWVMVRLAPSVYSASPGRRDRGARRLRVGQRGSFGTTVRARDPTLLAFPGGTAGLTISATSRSAAVASIATATRRISSPAPANSRRRCPAISSSPTCARRRRSSGTTVASGTSGLITGCGVECARCSEMSSGVCGRGTFWSAAWLSTVSAVASCPTLPRTGC